MQLTKKIKHHKMVWVRRAMLWTAFVGLFASVYLLIAYITGEPIACGIVHGCDIVRASKWAYTFGIPRPLLGVIFYLGIIFLLVVRIVLPKHKPYFWVTLTILAASVGFVESAFLTFVQWVDIKAFCIWCVTSALMSTFIFVLSFFEGEINEVTSSSLHEIKYFFYSVCVAVVTGGVLLALLLLPQRTSKTVNSSVSSSEESKILIFPKGTSYEGPATSTVTIVEFVDIPCPVCRQFSPVMQAIRDDFDGKIKFAYRTFMLPEIHQFAKESAIAAHCADSQGKFIEYIDAAILNQQHLEREYLIQYAEALHIDSKKFALCLDDPAIATVVESERRAGERLGVDSTPSIFMNATLLKNVSSYKQLKQAIESELEVTRLK